MRKKIKCKNWKLNKHEKLPITWLKKKRGSVQILDLERDSRRTHSRAVNCLYTITLRRRRRTRKKPRERNKEDSFKCLYIYYLLYSVFLCIYLFALVSLCFLFGVYVYTFYKSRILCKCGNSPLHRGERVLQWALLTHVHRVLPFFTYRTNRKYSIVQK